VLERLAPAPRPSVIFVTAFDEYAVRAFEVHAVDYLLKPFDAPRLALALARCRERLGAAGLADERRRLDALLAAVRPAPPPERLLVRGRAGMIMLSVDELTSLQAADNYVVMHTAKGEFLVRETLTALEARLDPARFVRVHRSALVQLAHIDEVQPQPRGELLLVLRTGPPVRVSRALRDALLGRVHVLT
jgi:two-component system, LytTR family, response regulator